VTRPDTASTETIAAIATPPGRGGVGIIRVSGTNAAAIARTILGIVPDARQATYLTFHNSEGNILDQGIALYFPAPHSFTGEDVLELQGHGGPVVLDLLLQACLQAGARMARPGEFSERAFLNDKLDLAQAEAIADLIEAGTVQAARSALQSLQGVFSDWVHATVEELTELRMYVEAAIDFPEEEVDFLADEHITGQLEYLLAELQRVIGTAHQGQLLREGMRIVLAGQPNTGKSSLLNALAGRESAIVTDIPGTTRDVLKEEINIDGMPLHIIDTAGLREGGDQVEQEGMRRTWQVIEQADCVLLLIDDRAGFGEVEKTILGKLPDNLVITRVYNKIDLSGNSAEIVEDEMGTRIFLSAKTGNGIELLRDHLKQQVGFKGTTEGLFMARRRHLDALQRAEQHVHQGKQMLVERKAGELLAEELRLAQHSLGEITGEFTADNLLGRIFSSFCIGK
jgi:tRNA modification GTPase